MAARHRNARLGMTAPSRWWPRASGCPRSHQPALCHVARVQLPAMSPCSATVRLARHSLLRPDHLAADKGSFPWPSRRMRAGGGWQRGSMASSGYGAPSAWTLCAKRQDEREARAAGPFGRRGIWTNANATQPSTEFCERAQQHKGTRGTLQMLTDQAHNSRRTGGLAPPAPKSPRPDPGSCLRAAHPRWAIISARRRFSPKRLAPSVKSYIHAIHGRALVSPLALAVPGFAQPAAEILRAGVRPPDVACRSWSPLCILHLYYCRARREW